jgi:dTDP-4-amino-4,6-dideoxygalactose transaminase
MNVPLLDLQPQMQRFRDEILQEVTGVIDSTRYILGPRVERLEQEVAGYCGTLDAVGVSSGTDALLVALMALGIGAGDLVLTTPFTFFATMGSIVRVGAMPVFADVEKQSLNIDPAHMAEILSQDRNGERKIKAIMPVHLYGQCADMQKIIALAEQYGIPIIEDAAQAIGAECPLEAEDGAKTWKRAGSMGIAGCFSFFPSKNLGCIGDGGIVTTNDAAFAGRLRNFRNHGADPKYFHSFIGGNFRLDPIQACVLSIKLPSLTDWHRQRRENASYYRQLFDSHKLTNNPVCLPTAIFAQTNNADRHDYHIYNQFVIRVPQRDELLRFLHENSIGCEIYYPLSLHQQKCLAEYGYGELSFPVAEQAATECLALPIYPELRQEQQEYVVTTIARFYQTSSD